MPSVRVLPAEMRVDRVSFSRLPEFTKHTTDTGTYVCAHCTTAVAFRTRNFEKHFDTSFTNLDAFWHNQFTSRRPLQSGEWEAFLDFACPGCGAPVRIIYRAGPEWAMGCHGWQLIEVLEAECWPSGKADA